MPDNYGKVPIPTEGLQLVDESGLFYRQGLHHLISTEDDRFCNSRWKRFILKN